MDLGGLVARNARMIPEHEGVVSEDRRYSWKIVTLKKDQKLTLEGLREFLKPRMADYKIPRLLEIVEQLPMNVSGKVLKYKLREQFSDKAVK